jgi:MFS family permease
VLGVIGNNAWMSWMGDLVPPRLRASYFSRRAAWSTLAGALGMLGTGLILDAARKAGHGAMALGLLSVVAWAAGLVCSLLIRRQIDPARIAPTRTRPLKAISQPWMCRRARPVLAYQLLWNAAIGLAASFFGVFLLRDLRAGFTFLAFHGAVLAVTRALATPVWGRTLNRVGTRPVLVATSFGIALLPLLWLLPHRHDFAGPLMLEAAVSGVLWAGHGLASFQLPFTLSSRESRPFYSAALLSTGGVAFAVAGVAGGGLLPLLPKHFHLFGAHLGPLHALFLLSSILRLSAWIVSLRVHEPEAAPVPELWRGLRWWPRWLRRPGNTTSATQPAQT